MKRSLSQNDMFHGLCREIAKQRPVWNGIAVDESDWKQLVVCGHAVATKKDYRPRLVKGLEGELINLRESTAKMTKERGASLLEYTIAWCANLGIDTGDYNG
jgi:hypothetical protein